MKKSTKFFILTTVVNIVLSVIIIFTSFLKEIPIIDIATFYATAFGAGASVAAIAATMMVKQKTINE